MRSFWTNFWKIIFVKIASSKSGHFPELTFSEHCCFAVFADCSQSLSKTWFTEFGKSLFAVFHFIHRVLFHRVRVCFTDFHRYDFGPFDVWSVCFSEHCCFTVFADCSQSLSKKWFTEFGKSLFTVFHFIHRVLFHRVRVCFTDFHRYDFGPFDVWSVCFSEHCCFTVFADCSQSLSKKWFTEFGKSLFTVFHFIHRVLFHRVCILIHREKNVF